LVYIYGLAQDLTDEKLLLSQKIMATEDLMKASLYPDFDSMKMAADHHLAAIESIHLD